MRLRLSPLLLLPAAAAVVSAYTSQQHTFQTDDEPKDYLSYFKRAALSLSQGKYSSALSDFNKILELKPDFDQARLQRAKILLRDGNLDNALKDTKIILKHSPKDTAAETLLSSIETTASSIKQAKAAEAAKNYDDCVKHLSIATQGAAALASLRRMRADCNLARGEVEEAAGDLTRAVQLDPSVPGPQITLAQLNYFLLYTPETALPHLKQCLHYDREHRECIGQFKLLKKFAKDMEKVENEASAGKWASATGRLLGTGVTGAGTKGLIKEEEGTVKKIQERLSLPGKLPRRLAAKLHKLACQGFATLKDGEKGHKYCTSALEFDENDIDALIGLGESQLLLSDYELAVQTLSKAAEITEHQNRKVQETLAKAQRLLQQSKRKDYYKVLGVDREATQQEIKKAYRKLAVEWHPDKRKADERELAKAKMQEINEANDILSNEDLRRRFDQGDDPNDPHGGHHEGGNPFQAGGFPHAFFQQGGPFGGGQFKFHFE